MMPEFFGVIISPEFYIPFFDLVSGAIIAAVGLMITASEHERIKRLPKISRRTKNAKMRETAAIAVKRSEKLAGKRRWVARGAAIWLIISSAVKIWNVVS